MIMVLTLSDFLITTVHIAAEMRTKRLLIAEKTAERKKVRPCFARPLPEREEKSGTWNSILSH